MIKKIVGIFVCMLLIIAALPAIGANKSYTEEYSKENELHTISMKATCHGFGFPLSSLHLLWIWLIRPDRNFSVFALGNLTIKVDGEIVDVNTPVEIEFWGFKGLATPVFVFFLTNIIFGEKYIFDVRVYGICNSIDFHEPIYP